MRLLALPQDWRYGVLELGQQIAGEECPKSDACEHWRTCEMCNGVMGQCKKNKGLRKRGREYGKVWY